MSGLPSDESYIRFDPTRTTPAVIDLVGRLVRTVVSPLSRAAETMPDTGAASKHSSATLITIHGMGRTKPNYDDDLVTSLSKRLKDRAHALDFASVYYQDLLEPNQKRVWKDVSGLLRWRRLRAFALFFLADAAGLETRKSEHDSPYTDSQIVIAKRLYTAHTKMGGTGSIVFLAHSLGCQVLSNYLWDAQRFFRCGAANVGIWRNPHQHAMDISGNGNFADDELKFLAGNSVRFIYTTGCNIPMFVAAHSNIPAIDAPNDRFEWHNFFDKDDALGWPLQPLSASYQSLVSDHSINAVRGLIGWLFKGWNPLSHDQYWYDADVLSHLQSSLEHLLP